MESITAQKFLLCCDGFHHSTEVSSENTDKTEEKNSSDTEIQTKTLYGMAESFLKAVKSLER